MRRRVILVTAALVGLAVVATAPGFAGVFQRSIDDNDTVVMRGNVHPLAQPEFDVGRTDISLPMERMILCLQLRPEAQARLDQLLEEQQDPASPNYHRWLTPEEFGARFGRAPEELAAVTGWLSSHGFIIDEVGKGRTWINFTGTVADVERAFHTQIHDYLVDDELHRANAEEPAIPRALSDLVAGVVSLHDFRARPASRMVDPNTNVSGGRNWLSPGDLAIIYNVNPLYSAGLNGSGQTVAVVGRTNIKLADVQGFRSYTGLPTNDPQFILNGSDPGIVTNDEGEADLDVEWAGALAKNATIKFVITGSTSTTDGIDLSAQYIVNNNLAAVMSTSYGQCESRMGSAKNSFYNNLWAQAAAQGITSFISSGDGGAAGCDAHDASTGTGLGVSGLCSTPNNVCVGGTEFMDTSNPSAYWASSNDSTTKASALSYIPEQAWNESGNVSGGSGLWSTGGGVSTIYPKPSWQVAPGVPVDAKRDTPDVSLAAAGHNAYIVFMEGSSASNFHGFYGTSASTPSFASLMALIVQKTGQRQGNANPRFYQLGNAQYGGSGPTVFHDVTTGNNSVPGVTGFSCTTGYDLPTGLGSVDANALVNNWSVGASPDFAISASPGSVSAQQGGSGTTTVSATISGGFSAAISLSASGLPSGATAAFSPTAIAAPGSGSSTLTLAAGGSTPAGTYTVTITGSGGTKTHSTNVSLTVTTSGGGGNVTIFSDNFEGSFPGNWQLYRGSSAAATEWGKVTCKAASGSGSAWCAAGGSQPQTPCSQYVGDMETWLYYGPFSLADATAASAEFDAWYDTESYNSSTQEGDQFWWLISTDGSDFYGYYVSGSSGGWVHKVFDFSAVTSITAIGGQQVWFAFVFTSDSFVNGGGAFVDNVVIKKTTGTSSCSFAISPSSQSIPNTGGTGSVNVTVTSGSNCSWTASSTAAWIHVTGGSSGSGNGTVSYSVDANAGAVRSGTISIAGKTFTVNEAGASTTCAAVRSLPGGYAAGQAVSVAITTTPPSGSANHALEDAPPSGWVVSGIDNDGVWDGGTGKVKWGPYFDTQGRTLHYVATPPSGATGTVSFQGVISIDGVPQAICGDASLSPGAYHPADTTSNWRIDINEATAYGSAWKQGATWPKPPNPIPIDYVTNAGYLWKLGETYHYDASKSPPWAPGATPSSPLVNVSDGMVVSRRAVGGAARRSVAPTGTAAGGGLRVVIDVAPAATTLVWAVEDAPPPGWVISAIDSGGRFDPNRGTVKWGPFFDHVARPLSYTVTPRGGGAEDAPFAGVVSFNGSSIAICGERARGCSGSALRPAVTDR